MRSSTAGVRLAARASVCSWLVLCVAGCGAAKDWEIDVDLTFLIDDIQEACGGTFRGTVVNADREDEEDRTYLPCTQAGEDFVVTVDVASQYEECGGSEDQEDIDCHHASRGNLPLHWELAVDGDVVFSHDSGASIINYASAVLLECGVGCELEPGPSAPRETFDEWPEVSSFSDRFSQFVWDKRHTEDGASVHVWEICSLPVDESER